MNASSSAPDAPTPDGPKPGQVLGSHYRLMEELARGGMGQVFVALDTRLRRRVAIKLVGSPSQRFIQEAQALARLNHPNILAIYDSGEYRGHRFLVCELLEGKTLRERVARSPLQLPEALDVAVEMARGLLAAHREHIIHRDLKPENVFITREGSVKLLDFGIAKLAATPTSSETLSADAPAPSGTSPAGTEEGRVVGTAGYMAPEQVRGDPLDGRADFFSFGAVLYELAAGRRAFYAPSFDAACAAILNQQPPPLPRSVPSGVRRIVERCLEKDPGRRFQDAAALLAELESVRTRLQRNAIRMRLITGVMLLVTVAIAVVVASRVRNPSRGALAILPLQADAAGSSVAPAIEAALQRALASAQDLPGETQWTLRSALSASGVRLRLVAQFESAGQRVGRGFEAAGSAEELEKDAEDLAAKVREEFVALWREHLRGDRAHALAHSSAAEEKLLSYYALMGRSARIEFLDRGRKLLDDALAADPRYLPALAERSVLLRLAADRDGEDRQAGLRLSRADADAALRLAPRDPQALLAECLTARLQTRDWPSDRDFESATAACSDAAQADPESAQAPYTLAMLYDQGCQIDRVVETLKLALDRARRYDLARVRLVTFYLVSVALQRNHLQEADRFSADLLAEEARADRLRALAPAASPPPMEGAHVIRAAVLLRLDRFDEAEKELETELVRGASAIGGLDEVVEAAGLRGLARIEARRGKARDRARAVRLAALEEQFAAADARSSGPSRIAGWYGFVDPEAAMHWLDRRRTPASCGVAFQRATIFRDAGYPDRAARALAECTSSEEWARRCVRVTSSDLPAPK